MGSRFPTAAVHVILVHSGHVSAQHGDVIRLFIRADVLSLENSGDKCSSGSKGVIDTNW